LCCDKTLNRSLPRGLVGAALRHGRRLMSDDRASHPLRRVLGSIAADDTHHNGYSPHHID
jgi:hypothetical protein